MKFYKILILGLALTALFTASAWAGSFSISEIKPEAKALAVKMNIETDKIVDLMNNLDLALNNEWLAKQSRYRKFNGVFVYEAGQGGLIVKIMEGDGLVSFKGGRQAGRFDLKSWSVGAQAGGGGIWGVGLVVDLDKDSDFGGDYSGKTQGAIAGDAGTYNWVVMSKYDQSGENKLHDLFLMNTGRGFGFGIAHEKLTVIPSW